MGGNRTYTPARKHAPIIAVFFMALLALVALLFPAKAASDSVSVTLSWVTSSSGDLNGDALTASPEDHNSMGFSYQVRVSNLLGESIEAGDLEIRLPRYLYEYRDATGTVGNNIYGAGEGVELTSISIGPDGSAASASVPFTYHFDGDDLVITNAREFMGAANAIFIINYAADPIKTESGTHAEIQATYRLDGSATAASNPLELDVNTTVIAREVTKKTVAQMGAWRAQFGAQPADFDDYYYFWYQVAGSAGGSQPLQYTFTDTPGGNGEVVGYYSSYQAIASLECYSTNANYMPDGYRPRAGSPWSWGSSSADMSAYVLVRYPKTDGHDLENSVTLTVTGIDGASDSVTLSEPARATASDSLDFEYDGDLYSINKRNSSTSGYVDLGTSLLKNGYDITLAYSIRTTATAYREGEPFVTAMGDDLIQVKTATSDWVNLSDGDYTFSSVGGNVVVYDIDRDNNTAYVISGADVPGRVKMYVRQAGSSEYTLYSEFAVATGANILSTVTNRSIPSNTVGVKWVFEDGPYSVSMAMYPQITINANSPTIQALMADDPDTLTVRNLSFLSIYDAAGNLINEVDESSYASSDANYKEALLAHDRETHGHLVQRDRVDLSVGGGGGANGHSIALSSQSENNDENRYDLKYRVTAHERYQFNNAAIAQLAATTGAMTTRNTAVFYVLLPEGVQFHSIDSATQSGYLVNASNLLDATVTDLQLTDNYHGSRRQMVAITVAFEQGLNYIVSNSSSTQYYVSTGFAVNFNCTLSYAQVNNGFTNLPAHSAYQTDTKLAGTAYADIGTGTNAPTGNGSDGYRLFYNLAGSASVNTGLKNTIYATVTSNIDISQSTGTNFYKSVISQRDSVFSGSTLVGPVETYKYRININNGDTALGVGELKNVILYDNLENAGSDWHGTFNSVDVTQAQTAGIDPVIYYSTNRQASFDLTSGDWSTTLPGNPADVKSVAVDLSAANGGGDYIFQPGDAIHVDIIMDSPTTVTPALSGTYARNSAFVRSLLTISGGNPEDMDNSTSTTKVRLKGDPDNIVVDYQWVGDNLPTGVNPPSSDTIAPGTYYTEKAQAPDPSGALYFVGWYLDEDLTQRYFPQQLEDDTTLYGKWEPMIKVEYRWFGAYAPTDVQPPNTEYVYPGTSYISHPPTPSANTRYTFFGWYTKAVATSSNDYIDGTTIVQDTVLYGTWSLSVQVDYQWVGDVIPDDVNPPTADLINYGAYYVAKGQEETAYAYRFDGWYREASCDTRFVAGSITEDTTIYGKWVKQIQVDYVWMGTVTPSDVYPPDSDIIDTGTAYTAKTQEETSENMRFDGWYKNAALTEKYTDGTVLHDNTVLYGKWVETITVDYVWVGSPQPTDVSPPASDTIDKGTSYTAKAQTPSAQGMRFSGWYTDAACTTPYVNPTALTQNTTLYGYWVAEIAVTYEWVGSVRPSDVTPPSADTIDKGTAYTSKTQDSTVENMRFEGWYTDNTCQTPYTDGTVIHDNTTLYGRWIERIHVQYEWVGDVYPSDVTAPLGEWIDKGTAYTAKTQAATAEDYRFAGWYNENTCDSDYTDGTVLTENTTLYGYWTQQVTIDYEWVGPLAPGDVTPPDTDTIDKGAPYTSKPQEDTTEDLVFEGWYTDPDCTTPFVDGSEIYGDTTLYGRWRYIDIHVDYQWVGDDVPGDVQPPARDTLQKYNPYTAKEQEKTGEGYVFNGWYLDETLTQPFEGTDSLENSMILYGDWRRVIGPDKAVDENSAAGKDNATVQPGSQITYRIGYTNYTVKTADVLILDELDNNVQFVSASDGGTYEDDTHTVTWRIDGVPADESGFVTLTVVVTAQEETTVENTAGVVVGNHYRVDTNTVQNPVEIPAVPNPPTPTGTGGDGNSAFTGDTTALLLLIAVAIISSVGTVFYCKRTGGKHAE